MRSPPPPPSRETKEEPGVRYLKNVQAISDHLPWVNLTQPGETFEYKRVVSWGNGSGIGIYERAPASV